MVVRLADDAGHRRCGAVKKFVVVLLLAACSKEAPELISARAALVEREKKLSSFRLEATSTEKNQSARYSFSFAAPNFARGRIQGPRDVEVAFDGKQLISIDHTAQTWTVDQPPSLLHAVFAPFAPEGFRAPLLPSKGVTAKKVRHARAQDAIELSTSPGDGITVTWVLRMPSGDFLEKRTVNGTHTGVLMVISETCNDQLCVPNKLVEYFDEETLGETTVTAVELNPKFPPDTFTPAPPEGFQRQASTPTSAR